MFRVGASSGEGSLSGEEPESMDGNLQPPQPKKKKKKKVELDFGSSNEDENSLSQRIQPQSALTESIQKPLAAKKQTSFKEEVTIRTLRDEQVFDDDVFESHEGDIDENPIDDYDNSSEWDDSVSDSGNASIDEKIFFRRIDLRPNLTSRRSLITTLLHQNDRAQALANAASRSIPPLQRSRRSSPNGPSLAASPDPADPPLTLKRLKHITENPRDDIPRSAAQTIIMTTTDTKPLPQALSPRTTRRNMLATELSVSLRQHILWERQQKSKTANAVLKRRHTAHDVTNLKQYPEKVYMKEKCEEDINSSRNLPFSLGSGDYHSSGW